MLNQFRKFGLEAIRSHRGLRLTSEAERDRSQLVKWALWLGIPSMLLVPTGLGLWAMIQLFGLPDLPTCFTVSWSDQASTRLYCANLSANRGSASDLQAAIQMVNEIPRDEPLRQQADRLIQQWSKELLHLGEEAYQNGKLTDAIEIAERISYNVPTHSQAETQIQTWKDTWDKAEDLYERAQAEISDRNWFGALNLARQLLALGNRHWATTKHEELMQAMQAAKEGEQKQKPAQTSKNKADSPVQDYLTRLQQEEAATASAHLSKARQLARSGTLEGLQAAVDEAQQVVFGSDGYDAAQQAMSEWQHQIELMEDRPYLDRATVLASRGDEDSLQAAIAEASQIGWGRALYDEANQQIEQWRDRVFQLQAEARARQLDAMTGGHTSSPYQPVSIPASSSSTDSGSDSGQNVGTSPTQTRPAVDELPPSSPPEPTYPLSPALPTRP